MISLVVTSQAISKDFVTIERIPSRLYAIGDIHACPAELATLLKFLRAALLKEDIVVFIGDYIDRGSDSKGVIELLLEFRKDFPSTIFLKGNHEDMLLGYMGLDGTMGAQYMYNGGVQFLLSYQISSVDAPSEIASKLPETHLDFFLGLDRAAIVGDYIFVHAGLNPIVELSAQENKDLFWIRGEFIHNIHRFGKTVVFGHTPYREVLFDLPYKIGIDTGLVFGNRLTCIEVTKGEIIQVPRGSKKVVRKAFPSQKV